MAKALIEIKNESAYNKVKRIMAINDIPNSNRDLVVNEAIKLAAIFIDSLDEQSLEAISGLKKSM
jgi:hypothetical protein